MRVNSLLFRLLGLAALVLVALVFLSCDRDEALDPDADERQRPRASTFLAILARLPLPAEEVTLEYYDYAFSRETLGIPLPRVGASTQEIQDYRDALILEAVTDRIYFGASGAGFEPGYDGAAWEEEIGFNITAVDQELIAAFAPHFLTVLKGRFDPQRLLDAIQTDPNFSADLEVQIWHGVSYYAWLEDFQAGDVQTSFRPTGVGGRLFFDADYLQWAQWTEGIEAMIDAVEGRTRSVGDLPEMRAIAVAINELAAYRMLATTETLSATDPFVRGLIEGEYGKAAVEDLIAAGLVEPYEALGLGSGFRGRERIAVLVYVFDSSEKARRNALVLERQFSLGSSLAFRRPWREVASDFDVRVEETAVWVTVSGGSPNLGINAWLNLDGLILTR